MVIFDSSSPFEYHNVIELRYLRSDCTVVEYGHVEKGTLGTKNSHFPCQKLSGNGWHIFRLSVNANKDVNAYINGKKVGSFHAYFTSRGFGGVLVANGFNNVAEFRDFDISPQLADQDTNTPPAINPGKIIIPFKSTSLSIVCNVKGHLINISQYR